MSRKYVFDKRSITYLGDSEAAAKAIEAFLDTGDAPSVQGRARISGIPSIELQAELEQRRPALSDGLTAREIQVLRLVAGGQTNSEIAGELVLSVKTVDRHIANIYGKIGARGRADATVYALTRALV